MCAEALGLTTPDYYYYLNQSGTYDVDGMDDKQEYKEMRVSVRVCKEYTGVGGGGGRGRG